MKINQNTKISALIKQNPDVIDAIVSINKHFEKLRNPILRKILASRVTIADAAKIGGATTQAFYDKLIPLGFFCENTIESDSGQKNYVPEFYKTLDQKNVRELDVRNDIAQGLDPFNRIMDTLSQMTEETTIKLINSFEPIPLLNILAKKGYFNYTLHKGPSLVHTYIKHSGVKTDYQETKPASFISKDEEIEELIKLYEGQIINLDVRDLEMPLPMVTILNELDVLPSRTLLYVLHRKIPVYLFPELDSRGYSYKVKKVNEDKVLILIYKACQP